MQSNQIFDKLNSLQKDCVLSDENKILVVAGAGSGKTTVLVSKIYYYISVNKIKPFEILALTFTNKVGRELKERLASYVSFNVEHTWLTTFHSACLKILRLYGACINVKSDFLVIDPGHQKTLVNRIIKENNLKVIPEGKKGIDASLLVNLINNLKENEIRAKDLSKLSLDEQNSRYFDLMYALNYSDFKRLYSIYEQSIIQENVFDFPELILKVVEGLSNNSDFKEILQSRFKAILVDEFQDTNPLQYKLLRLLVNDQTKLFIVGDDDQAIYGFRGASAYNMQNIKDDYLDISVFKLDINYRSYQNILDVANVLISHNSNRLVEKHLNTDRGQGNTVKIIKCPTDNDERLVLTTTIQRLIDNGEKLRNIAILYRNNYLSARIEQDLRKAKFDYEVIGGHKFFDREEIVNIIGYLRLIVNDNDNTSFMRVVNVPKRKLGEATILKLMSYANTHHLSLVQAIGHLQQRLDNGEKLNKDEKSLYTKFITFYQLIKHYASLVDTDSLETFVQDLVKDSGLLDYYQQKDEKEQKADFNSRVNNIKEFISNTSEYDESYNLLNDEDQELEVNRVFGFLSHISLLSGTELNEKGNDDLKEQDKIQLLTIHAAKGLEFKHVFIVAFENDILPSRKLLSESYIEQSEALDEERRLAYVAITRAKENLFILYTKMRKGFSGSYELRGASKFLFEIRDYYVDQKLEENKRPFRIVSAEKFLSV